MGQEHFTLRNSQGRITDVPGFRFNDRDRDGRVSNADEAREVVLTSRGAAHPGDSIVLPNGTTQTYNDIVTLSRQQPIARTVITLPTIRATATVPAAIPGQDNSRLLVPGGIQINGLRIEVTATTHGQQLQLDNFPNGDFNLRTLPPANGQPRELTFGLHVTDVANGEGHHALDVTFRFSSQADQIVSQGNGQEMVVTLNELRFGPRSTGELSGVAGELSITGNTIRLNGINFSGNFPRIQARINRQTGEFRLEMRPVPMPTGVNGLPQEVAPWLALDGNYWQSRVNTMTGRPSAVVLSEASAFLPNAEHLIDRGLGPIYSYFPANQEGAVVFSANFNDQSSLERLQTSLTNFVRNGIQRTLPNPPPRSRDTGEPLALSYAQEDAGTLFFLTFRDAEGHVLRDENISEDFSRALGPDNAGLASHSYGNGRINWGNFLNAYTQNPAISGHMSRETVTALFSSYLQNPTELSQRRFHHRGMQALGSLLRTGTSEGLLALLSPTAAQPSMRPMLAHEFSDDRFRTTAPVAAGDGVDMRFTYVFDLSPDQVAHVLDTAPADRLDDWIYGASGNDTNRTYSVRGHNVDVVHRRRDNTQSLIVIDEFARTPATQGNLSRTYRLVPITAGGHTQTLVILEEHIDMPGVESRQSLPGLQRPGAQTNIFEADSNPNVSQRQPTASMVRDRLIQAVPRAISSSVDVPQNRSDAVAYLFTNIDRSARNPDADQVTSPSELVCLNPGSRTSTIRIIDYLSLARRGTEPILVINEIPRDSDIRASLQTRLGIEAPASWLARQPSPVDGDNRSLRQIPPRELWAASGLAPTHTRPGIDLEAFSGLTTALINPPPGKLREALSHLTSTTERYWIFLQELVAAITPQGPGTVLPTNGAYPMNFRVPTRMNFHSVISPGNTQVTDTADSMVFFYVPVQGTHLNGSHLADVGFHAELFTERHMRGIDSSVLIPSNRVPNAIPGDNYIATSITSVGPYLTNAGSGIITLQGGVTAAPWLMVPTIPGYTNSMLENWGTWFFIPVRQNDAPDAPIIGYVGIRYSITNTANQDTNPTVAETARARLPGFLSDLVFHAYEEARRESGGGGGASLHLNYTPGRSINENGANYP